MEFNPGYYSDAWENSQKSNDADNGRDCVLDTILGLKEVNPDIRFKLLKDALSELPNRITKLKNEPENRKYQFNVQFQLMVIGYLFSLMDGECKNEL